MAKGAIEPATGDSDFCFYVFVVPKHTGILCHIFNVMQFNCYMHTPTFNICPIKQVWQFIQHSDYAFSSHSCLSAYSYW